MRKRNISKDVNHWEQANHRLWLNHYCVFSVHLRSSILLCVPHECWVVLYRYNLYVSRIGSTHGWPRRGFSPPWSFRALKVCRLHVDSPPLVERSIKVLKLHAHCSLRMVLLDQTERLTREKINWLKPYSFFDTNVFGKKKEGFARSWDHIYLIYINKNRPLHVSKNPGVSKRVLRACRGDLGF